MLFKRRNCLNLPINRDSYANTGAAFAASGARFYMPEESSPHTRTWMQWPAHAGLYGDADYFHLVQLDLAKLARTIAQFEEVCMLARREQMADARHLCGPTVIVIAMDVDDMWARDSGPTFVINGEGAQAISDLNFNGWGDKQRHRDDANVASNVGLLQKIPCRKGSFISEGGAIEVDGDGTVLTTESAIINTNRNPGMDKAALEASLNAALGTAKVIWLPGVRGEDITDCHIDLLARFIRPGLVLVELMPEGDVCSEAKMAEHAVAALSSATDARGRKLAVVTMRRSQTTRSTEPDMCNGYANYYVCNGAVIVPEFGDASADAAAAEVLAGLYPGRKIVQVNVDVICENGGGIHCVTQQQPLVD